jgi:hypothetical protein
VSDAGVRLKFVDRADMGPSTLRLYVESEPGEVRYLVIFTCTGH